MGTGDNLLLMLMSALVAVGLLAGCGSAGQPAGAATASSVLVDYHRSGGIAGVDDHLVIYSDRKATLQQKSGQTEFTVDQATYDQLKQQLDGAKISDLTDEAITKKGGADMFSYAITYQGQTVKTQDTSVPASLQPAISTLNGIVIANGKK